MDFWDDDRGQSVQVGAVLLFAVLVILLAGYQSTVVPNENRSAEFDHSLETEQDMLDVRNAIIEAYQDGEAAPVSVKLGTTYPRHTFAVNPAPVSGTVSTHNAGTITVKEDGSQVSVCPVSNETKFLNYSAGYNYYSPAPKLVYENTVLYADYGENRQVVISNQDFVRNGSVNLVALQGNYSENGISATDFQARAGMWDSETITDPTITVPTGLSQTRWQELVGDKATVTVSGGTATFEFDREMTVYCSGVGAGSTPPGGDRPPNSELGGEDGDGGNEINPGENDVVFISASKYDKFSLEAEFKNQGNSTINATEARINYYFQAEKSKDTPFEATLYNVTGGSETTLGTLSVGGSSQDFNQEVVFEPDTSQTIRFEFDYGSNADPGIENDFFILRLYFEDGSSNIYFISAE